MGKKFKILITEDEAVTCLYYKKFFNTKNEFQILKMASTGEQAIEIAKKDNPDFILMDINLASELDGIETAKIIKTNQDIPIIFITGYDEKATLQKAQEVHPVGYFIKPVRLSEVFRLIEETLAKSHPVDI